jgi:hypothetical protein
MSNDSPYLGLGLTRLKDGRVMCCICFEYREKKDLAVETVNGVTSRWDVCKGACAVQAGFPNEAETAVKSAVFKAARAQEQWANNKNDI